MVQTWNPSNNPGNIQARRHLKNETKWKKNIWIQIYFLKEHSKDTRPIGREAHFADQASCKLIKIQGLCIWASGLRHMSPHPNFIIIVYVYLACMPRCTCICQRTTLGGVSPTFMWVSGMRNSVFQVCSASSFYPLEFLPDWNLRNMRRWSSPPFSNTCVCVYVALTTILLL